MNDFTTVAAYDMQPPDTYLFTDTDDPDRRLLRYVAEAIARHAADIREASPITVIRHDGSHAATNRAGNSHYLSWGQAWTVRLTPGDEAIIVSVTGGPHETPAAPPSPIHTERVPYPHGPDSDPVAIVTGDYREQLDRAIDQAVDVLIAARHARPY
ncbi:hypothetical protein ACFWYW_46605 [Nonomuraea sp. NPDC059023]|uniref:hypothetical protein n=1 Tax=unclassified Nonomuraea TaxID=2593643 RepID=UPI003695B52E